MIIKTDHPPQTAKTELQGRRTTAIKAKHLNKFIIPSLEKFQNVSYIDIINLLQITHHTSESTRREVGHQSSLHIFSSIAGASSKYDIQQICKRVRLTITHSPFVLPLGFRVKLLNDRKSVYVSHTTDGTFNSFNNNTNNMRFNRSVSDLCTPSVLYRDGGALGQAKYEFPFGFHIIIV